MTKSGYIAFVLDDLSRNSLLKLYPPIHPDTIAHHLTILFGVRDPGVDSISRFNIEFCNGYVQIEGYVVNDRVEAFTVSNSVFSEKQYHLTYSIDRSKGAKPVHSNQLIANSTPTKLLTPIRLTGRVEFISNN